MTSDLGIVIIPTWFEPAKSARLVRTERPARIKLEIVRSKDAAAITVQRATVEAVRSDAAMHRAVVDALCHLYERKRSLLSKQAVGDSLDWRMPPLRAPADLWKTVGPISILVHDVIKDGAAYIGFTFRTKWGPAEDLGALMHRARPVYVGFRTVRTPRLAREDATAIVVPEQHEPEPPDAERPPLRRPRAAELVVLERGPFSKASVVKLQLRGRKLHERAGKRGTQGKETVTTFKRSEEASAALDERRSAWLAKGYADLTGLLHPGGSSLRGVSLSNVDLERFVSADPYGKDALGVYADWLGERGDVRAELIRLDLARRETPDDRRLDDAMDKLMETFEPELLGPLAELKSARVSSHLRLPGFKWSLGFIRAARVWRFADDPPFVELVSRVLAHPSCALLEHLVTGGEAEGYDALFDLLAERRRPLLTSLHIGEASNGPADLGRALTLPGIRALEADSSAMVTIDGRLRTCELESLRIAFPISMSFANAFADIVWPNLRSLSVPAVLRSALGPIFRGRAAPKLTHLTVERGMLDLVAGAPLRKQLEELVVEHLGYDGVQGLVDNAAGLRDVKRIVVVRPMDEGLEPRDARLLKKHLQNVVVDTSGPTDRFD